MVIKRLPQFKQHLTQINSGSQSTLVWNSLEPFAGFHCDLCASSARMVKFDEMDVTKHILSLRQGIPNYVSFPKQGRRQGESILMLGEDFGCVCPDFALLLARMGFAFFQASKTRPHEE